MAETGYNAPLFGISFAPSARHAQQTFALAKAADSTGLDFITIQDHPYNPTFLDTFIFWPLGGEEAQIRHFAEEVVPAVRAAVTPAYRS
jgi:hypothetical protein